MKALLLATGLIFSAQSATAQTYDSSIGKLRVTPVVSGLDHPWSFAFLPDGRKLITERPGRMRLETGGKLSAPLAGLPQVYARGQGGLLDVILDRGFANNRTIYFCFADPMPGGARTSLARATLGDSRLDDVQVLFRQEGPPSTGQHFGCRIAQTADNLLFLGMGDHGSHSTEAQNLRNHIGKVIRIAPDGSVPKDNPFVGRSDAKPEIWSYGHRNIQGAALHPASGKFWEVEHGPRGGDEINVPEAGKNYGWPVIGYGIGYDGAKIHQGTHRDGMMQPLKYWVPSIAPSGMAFYGGTLFPAWKGHVFIGALVQQHLVRIALDGEKVTGEERLLRAMNERIRDVRSGPDGAIYLATDSSDGRILRVTPE